MATATKERTRNVPNLFSPGGFISGTKQAALSKREQLNDQLTSRVESAKKAGNLGRGPMGAGTEVSTSRNRQHGELRTIATYSPFRPHRTTWCSTTLNRDLFPFSPSPNDVVFDYTGPGIRRSIEDSLQRLGIDSLDIVFVHDISSDNKLLPTPWQEQFKIATAGVFPELTRMREEGLIKGWGIGVNTPEPILRILEVADPDVCLLASQYSLIDHKNALNNIFPVVRQKNASL